MIPREAIKEGASVFYAYAGNLHPAKITKVGTKNFYVESSFFGNAKLIINDGGGDKLWVNESDFKNYHREKEKKDSNHAWARLEYDEKNRAVVTWGLCQFRIIRNYEIYTFVEGKRISLKISENGKCPNETGYVFKSFLSENSKPTSIRDAIMDCIEIEKASLNRTISQAETNLLALQNFKVINS